MAGAADDERDVAFGVLGPLRVMRGGVAVPLGGRQQRAVLARLLLADGGGLSVDQLADALWGEHVPAGAASTIQTYVFHLRQALEPDRERGRPARMVITDNGRYRLAVPVGALDATSFERHLAAGHRLLADGSPADALTELDQALDLWRGDVLADLADYDFVQPAATRLADKRLAALEAKFDAELALGRHADVLAELNELVARYPLNEQLQRQRMLALYRCGRASDALVAYDHLRRQLVDELGADPSPPLQQLHQQLLTHDPTLTWQRADGRQAVSTRPPPPSATEAAPELVRFGPERVTTPARRRQPPWLRTRWLVAAIAVLVLIAAGTIAGVIVTHRPKHTLSALPPNNVAVIDANGAMHDAVPVGQSPEGLAYGADSLWVAETDDDAVQRVNPKTHEVIQTIPVGSDPVALTVSGNHVWVANSTDSTVTEIDADTNRVVGDPIDVGALPAAIAAGPTGVWVADSGDNDVRLIDTDSATVKKTVSVGEGPDGLLVDGSSLWVANGRDRTLSHLDAATGNNVSGSIPVGAGAIGMALAAGSLWVANQADLSVTRIDPTSGATLATIPVRDGPTSVAALRGRLWISDQYDATVAEIDPATNRVTHHATGSSVHGVAAVGNSLWVTSRAASIDPTHIGGTLTFSADDPGTSGMGIDPVSVYGPDVGAMERVVYDGLLTLRVADGLNSLGLVPDLAVKVPIPTNGGRRYTFTLRRGIRYSNGTIVKASDIQRGFRRELTVEKKTGNPGLYTAVKGAENCISSPQHCDLSAGVHVDDTAGLITFELAQPDPAFLYKLALSLVVATAPGAPDTESTVPLPGTGPYMISAYKRGQLLELRRNPYFHQWSYAAQPAGYPDVIRFVKSDAGGSWKDVLAGRADVSYFPSDFAEATALLRQHRSQVHSQPLLNTFYLSMNPHTPPFNDVRVRRALSAAINRRTLVALFGGAANAIPTCQLLPVGFPGHRTYCPYADADFAPRTAMAQALVQQSRTAGQEVTVWGGADQDGSERVTRYVASVLTQLGYRPAVHLTPTSSWLDRLRGADVQVGMVPGWNADYPEAGSFFGSILTCASAKITTTNNVNRYCDPRLDEMIDSATKAERTDPAQALAQWTAVDKKTVDDAPLAPTVNGVQSMLVSRRLGNFQQTPLAGLLFGQMWVQ